MKTNRFVFAVLTLAATTVAMAAPAARPAKPACCTMADAEAEGEAAPAKAAAVSARSLYQLDTTWTTDAGAKTTLAALRGHPVVLAMFFTSCEYACPLLVADMQHVRQSLPANVRDETQFVLVSFDAARDTPGALKTYRAQRGLDASWTLLHGDATEVQELAMLLGVKFKEDGRGQFSHSNTITVLNPEGEIAGQRNGLGGDVAELAGKVVASARL